MTRVHHLVALAACIILPRLAFAGDPPVVGRWQTIDDKTGKPASIVRTYLEGGKLFAKIEKLLRTDAKVDQRCDKCDGDKKDKPVVGMVVMWDLGQEGGGEGWEGGKVLDPENGTEYRCKLKAVGSDLLEVRGFVGISLFGRTQTWHRVADAAPAPTPAPAGVVPSAPQNK